MTEISVLPKISAKTVGADASVAKGKASGTQCPLYKVFGVANKVDYIKDQNDNLKPVLRGTFQAVNVQKDSAEFGKFFQSGKLFMPDGIQDMIVSAVEGEDGTQSNATEFAIEIASTPATNKAGYTFQGVGLAPPANADPLQKMREQALNLGTLLKAPDDQAKVEDKSKEKAPA